jgi:hypothetical protein
LYGTELYVPQFPTLIPKFYAVTTLICESANLPKQLTVRLNYGDEEIAKAVLDQEDFKEFKALADIETLSDEGAFSADDPSKVRLTVSMMISPFVVRDASRLSSIVDTEAGTTRAGSLRVVQRDGIESDAIPLSASLAAEISRQDD